MSIEQSTEIRSSRNRNILQTVRRIFARITGEHKPTIMKPEERPYSEKIMPEKEKENLSKNF